MEKLEIKIWDVQHGSAAYIKTPIGKNIVIDLGTGSYKNGSKTFSPLKYLKDVCGISRLDQVIITHPHTDHIDDIFSFDEMNPKVLTRPNHLSDEEIQNANGSIGAKKTEKYIEINNRYNLPVEESINPLLPANNGGVIFHQFIPTGCGRSNINNHSVVTIIEYLGYKVIIPGDNESPSWKELLENQKFVEAITNADILVASHHGRESGYYDGIFDYFSPQLVIISDGPVSATSVTPKYDYRAEGRRVYSRGTGHLEMRKCLTTRKDGVIVIEIGKESDKKNMKVTID